MARDASERSGRRRKPQGREVGRVEPGRLSDTELVDRCRAGQEHAWQELLLRYSRLIYATARRHGADGSLADDVLQSVALTLFERLSLIADPACLPRWLAVTTARRTALLLSRERRFPVAGPPDLPDPGPDPRELALREDLSLRLAEAMAELREADRELLRDLFERELPYTEIARRRGLAVGSLGSLRARALERLRRILARKGVR